MNINARNRWEMIRQNGKRKFIFKIGGIYLGILAMGLAPIILMIFISFWRSNYSFEFMTSEFIGQNIFRLIFSYPAGLLLGWLVWTLSEWSFAKSN